MSVTQQAPPSGSNDVARNGAAREQLSEIQRARILAAAIDVVGQEGAANATIAHIVARSGVSRRTFYEIFTDRDDCFLAAFDDAVARAINLVKEAHDHNAKWATSIRSGLIVLLGFLEEEPLMARLLIVESLAAGPRALQRRTEILNQIICIVDRGHSETGNRGGPPPLTAEATVGAVLSILHARISQKDPGGLVELANPLMSTITLPYLGGAASRRELTRPVPKYKRIPPKPHGASDPLRNLEMRLTYRTVRVLGTIASNPGSSNRAVGERSGMTDQGQISKLLARLKNLGLIQTTGNGAATGEPNAWTLTPHGQSVVQMVS